MAINIKFAPVLYGKDAERFIDQADKNLRENRGKINFQKEIEICEKILKKANLSI